MPQRRRRDSLVQRTVGDPAAILAPSYFRGVEAKVFARDMVMLAHFGATKAGEVAFRLVGTSAIPRERNRVVDPTHLVMGVQRVPAARLVGMDDAAHGDDLPDQRHAIGLARYDERAAYGPHARAPPQPTGGWQAPLGGDPCAQP